MPEDFDPNAREIRTAMTYKERLLLGTDLTPEQAEQLEEAWTVWTRGDAEREELFFAAFQLGLGTGLQIICAAAEKTIADVKKKAKPE